MGGTRWNRPPQALPVLPRRGTPPEELLERESLEQVLLFVHLS